MKALYKLTDEQKDLFTSSWKRLWIFHDNQFMEVYKLTEWKEMSNGEIFEKTTIYDLNRENIIVNFWVDSPLSSAESKDDLYRKRVKRYYSEIARLNNKILEIEKDIYTLGTAYDRE